MTQYQMIPRRVAPRRHTRILPHRKRGAGNRSYREWIITLPCLVCQSKGLRQCTHTEGHHYGPRGLGQKTPDARLVPLCAVHHRTGSTSVHVLGREFAAYHGLDIEAKIVELNERYRRYAALEAA